MAKVFIKMVPHKSVQNRKDFIADQNGKKEITKSKSKGTNGQSIFRFVVSHKKSNLLNTGFDKKVENPYYEQEDKLPSLWRNSNIHTKKEITRQTYFELKLNKQEGSLVSVPKDMFKKGKVPFIQNFSREFQETTVLDLDDPMDELTFWLLKQSSADKCAPSWEERTPFSRIYISHEYEAEEKVAKETDLIENTIARLVELKKEGTESDLKKISVILKTTKGEISPIKIKTSLSNYINKKGVDQKERIEIFNKLLDQMQDLKTREIFEARYLLQECINQRIISDYKGKYIWSSKKGSNLELLGKSEQEAINTLIDIDWRNYREELIEELKAKIDDNRIMAL